MAPIRRNRTATADGAAKWLSTVEAVEKKLARLPARERGLPMPYCSDDPKKRPPKKMSLKEFVEHRLRRAWQHEQDQGYEAGWERPEIPTANEVWDLLLPALALQLKDLFTSPVKVEKLPRYVRRELEDTAKQALLIVVDHIIRAGEQGRSITQNYIFDALAAKWSDNFGAAKALQVRDMRLETAMNSRRDLLRAGIDFGALWGNTVVRWRRKKDGSGGNRLYSVRRIKSWDPDLKMTRLGGYQVKLERGSPELARFRELIQKYRPRESGWRLLFADDRMPPRKVQQEVCAEHPYNIAELGPPSDRAKALLDAQEDASLTFDARSFLEDYIGAEAIRKQANEELHKRFGVDLEESALEDAPDFSEEPDFEDEPTRQPYWALQEKYEEARGLAEQFSGVWKRLTGSDEVTVEVGRRAQQRFRNGTLIKSGFHRLINRRSWPDHFWPVPVSGHPFSWDAHTVVGSPRKRWFRLLSYPDPGWAFVGVDISSSVTQILAFLLGFGDLERAACSPGKSFNAELAKRAWEQQSLLSKGVKDVRDYTDAKDPRLKELVKNTWMRTLYGSPIGRIVWDQWKKPSVYGPGWQSARDAKDFVTNLPWYDQVKRYLDACKMLAERAYGTTPADHYAGVLLTDPLDEAKVRWNYAERDEVRLSSGGSDGSGLQLLLSLPGKWVKMAEADEDWIYQYGLRFTRRREDKRVMQVVRSPERQDPRILECVECGARREERSHDSRCEHDCKKNHDSRRCERGCKKKWTEVFQHAPANSEGDYPVDLHELKKEVAPMTVHMLDAYLAACVMERLRPHKRKLVNIFDGWFLAVPRGQDAERARDLLDEAVRGASEEWFEGLGHIYKRFTHYLKGTEFEDDVRRWEEKWKARKQKPKDAWPRFRY